MLFLRQILTNVKTKTGAKQEFAITYWGATIARARRAQAGSMEEKAKAASKMKLQAKSSRFLKLLWVHPQFSINLYLICFPNPLRTFNFGCHHI